MSRLALSRCSGGIEGRPRLLYIVSKSGERRLSASASDAPAGRRCSVLPRPGSCADRRADRRGLPHHCAARPCPAGPSDCSQWESGRSRRRESWRFAGPRSGRRGKRIWLRWWPSCGHLGQHEPVRRTTGRDGSQPPQVWRGTDRDVRAPARTPVRKLKNRWASRPVWVRIPPSAPEIQFKSGIPGDHRPHQM